MHRIMSRSRRVRPLATVALAAAACAPGAASTDAGSDATGDGPNAALFDDEMNGTALDGSAWLAVERPGDSSLGELQCYRPAEVAETGGALAITSQVDSSCAPLLYGSGMVQWKTFSFLYGTLEIRARGPGGKGPWPVVRLLGADCQAQNATAAGCSSDEIVVAEGMGADHTTVWQSVRVGATALSCSAPVTDTSQTWHTYRLAWAADALTWQVDGVATCTQATAPAKPMFLIVDTAVGGAGGAVDPGTLPQQHLVDYVRVWR